MEKINLRTRARVDADGQAKPLTRIIHHPPAGSCIGPGTVLFSPGWEEIQTGERIELTEEKEQ